MCGSEISGKSFRFLSRSDLFSFLLSVVFVVDQMEEVFHSTHWAPRHAYTSKRREKEREEREREEREKEAKDNSSMRTRTNKQAATTLSRSFQRNTSLWAEKEEEDFYHAREKKEI